MSETSGVVTLMRDYNFNLKSVGGPLDGIDLKIFNPDEKGIGEICFRGRNIMMGYLKNDAATKETIDP
jgi:long-chain-fatty-acid--CoA ligase ACSBG